MSNNRNTPRLVVRENQMSEAIDFITRYFLENRNTSANETNMNEIPTIIGHARYQEPFEWIDESQAKEDSSKFKSPAKDPLAQFLQEEEPPKKDSRFLLPKLIMAEGGPPPDQSISGKRQESIMQWFDRAVERELKKRRDKGSDKEMPSGFVDNVMPVKDLSYPKSVIDKMAEASSSRIEIVSHMSMLPDTELQDVVDKYAKAEAMCAFAGAVKAAEAAAEAAPPELAEEAALASARVYQSELNATEIKDDFQGMKPMEVVGYIGITKPKYPVRSEKK